MPIDLEHTNFKRAFRGYAPEGVDQLIQRCSQEIETLLGENVRLRDQIAGLEETVARYRMEEQTLRDSIVMAQRAADDTRASANRHADVILEEARQSALAEKIAVQQKVSELRWEIERLKDERRRHMGEYKAFLERQLREIEPVTLSAQAVVESESVREVTEA